MVTRGEEHVSRGQTRPKLVGAGMRNSNQTLRGDQTRCEENFTRSTTPRALAKIFLVTRMLRRDLFAVANFLLLLLIVNVTILHCCMKDVYATILFSALQLHALMYQFK